MTRLVGVLVAALSLVAAGVTPALPQDSDAIVYSAYRYGGRGGAAIFSIVPGGEPVKLTGSRTYNVEPVWSPDRSKIAYVHHSRRPRNLDIWVMDADGSDKVRLTTGRSEDVFPQWSPDGSHLAWVKGSSSGRKSRIYVMHPDGSDKMPVSPEKHRAYTPEWSPDGNYVAYVHNPYCNDCDDDAEIFVVDGHAAGATPDRLTDNDLEDFAPDWSPDGGRIVFSREDADGGHLFTMAADGSDEQQLTETDGFAYLAAWSPDGTEIAYTLVVDEQNFHTRLALVDVASGQERLLTDVEAGGILPRWSPDGSRIGFVGFHSGDFNLGVVGRDGTGLEQVTDSPVDEAWLDW